MIIGKDMVVESGNGRALGLSLASELYPDNYTKYVDYLKAHLEEYGIKPEDIAKIKNPVLVRERTDTTPRVEFANEANRSTVLAMSPTEKALQDASFIQPKDIATIDILPEETLIEALKRTRNNDFVQGFMQHLSTNERAGLLDAAGRLNDVGIDRMVNAIFASVYTGDTGIAMLNRFKESIDPGVTNLKNALMSSLNSMVKLENGIRLGNIDPEYSIANDVSKVVDMFVRKKAEGMNIDDYLAQESFLPSELDAFQSALLKVVADNARSSTCITQSTR